tara:strand:+ start:1213 stop:1377 length:165 start_codon:yes stop_codon:yes gene_type:complete
MDDWKEIMTNGQLAVSNLKDIVRMMREKNDAQCDHYADMIEWQIRRLDNTVERL